jgi:hypothetical protein
MLSHKIPTAREIKELRLEVLVKMSELAVAGFGLVAALAWNEAIQSLVNSILPKTTSGGIIAQLFYAILITGIIVLVTLKLSKLTTKAKEELDTVKDKSVK